LSEGAQNLATEQNFHMKADFVSTFKLHFLAAAIQREIKFRHIRRGAASINIQAHLSTSLIQCGKIESQLAKPNLHAARRVFF
jgi:hypothetical protein